MNELNNLIDIKVKDIATDHPRYFAGQYLLADDFNLQHQYLNDRLRYTNKSLHVSGIIEGLTVEKEGTNSVKITPGAAIDNQGNMIVLTEEKTFAEFNTINQGELYVKYIKHKEKPQQKKEKEKESYTRWQEIPQLVFADTTPETGVKLAKITLEEGAITKVVTDVREYSGLSLPTSDGTELTLRYGGKRQSTNEAVLTGSLHIDQDLTVDGQLGIGTNTPEAKLHIHGELKLQEGVKVNKISNDVELQEDSDQIIPTQKAIKTYADNTKALLAGNAAQNFNAKDLTVEGRLEIKGKMDVQDYISANGLILPSAGRENTRGIKFHSKPGGGKGDSAWIRYYVREGEKTTLEIGTGNDNYDHIALMPEKGNVGIGTNKPQAKLDIKGNLKLEEGVAVKNISNDESLQEDSDEIIPTQNAIKRYIDKKVNEVRAQILHRGMIMLWPVVKDSTKYQLPKGWKDCDGKNGRPSISGRLVCGYDISRKGLEEMKMAMDQSGSSISRMKFIGSVGNASDDFLYGNNVSVDGNGTELWMNYKLVESMIPNHKHVGRSRLSGEHNHGLRLTENGSDKLYFSGEYSVNKCSRFESALWHAQEPYRNVSSRDAHIAHGGEHDHHVTVGGGVGEGCEGTATVSQLPRPPLIVLRYIIYWPD
jgi:hypothetical protein